MTATTILPIGTDLTKKQIADYKAAMPDKVTHGSAGGNNVNDLEDGTPIVGIIKGFNFAAVWVDGERTDIRKVKIVVEDSKTKLLYPSNINEYDYNTVEVGTKVEIQKHILTEINGQKLDRPGHYMQFVKIVGSDSANTKVAEKVETKAATRQAKKAR